MARSKLTSVRGMPKLKKALEDLPRKLQGKAIRQSLRVEAKAMAAEVKANAPVESGKVKASVKVRSAKRKKGRIAIQVEVTGGHQGEPPIDSSGGNIIGFVEFGRIGQDPNPFIRNSFSKTEGPALDRIASGIKAGIEKISEK